MGTTLLIEGNEWLFYIMFFLYFIFSSWNTRLATLFEMATVQWFVEHFFFFEEWKIGSEEMKKREDEEGAGKALKMKNLYGFEFLLQMSSNTRQNFFFLGGGVQGCLSLRGNYQS